MERTVPFFAIEANELLLTGSYNEVISICIKNLDNYLYYPTCYILLIKASILNHDFEIAKKYLAIASELFPNLSIFHVLNNELYNILENQSKYENLNFIELENNSANEHLDIDSNIDKDNNIEIPKKINYTHSPIVIMDYENDNNSPVAETQEKNETVSFIEKDTTTIKSFQLKNFISSNSGTKTHYINFIPGLILSPLKLTQKRKRTENHLKPLPPLPPFPDYIENIHKTERNTSFYPLSNQDFITFAKEIINYNEEPSTADCQSNKTIEEQNKIEITETYANILFQQKAYKEALEIYKNLLERKPEKENLIKKKIQEIELILSSNT